jgi:isopenicillin-N N-acyltransferase-like protein
MRHSLESDRIMGSRNLSRRQVLGLAGTAAVVAAAPNGPGEPAEYPLYTARGTHRELGRQHGEQAARQIKAHVEAMRVGQKLSLEQLRRRAAQFQPAFERYCPHLLEEMRGLAEGAGVTLEEAMACNIRGELRYARQEGCTAYVIGRSGCAGREVIAGQNSDMGPEIIQLAYVLHLQPHGKPEVLIWTFGGMLGYHGLNSAGVAHFENALGGGPRTRFGLPHYPVERMMLECDRLDQVFDLLRKMPLEYSVNYVLCDGQGAIADAEATPEGPQILRDQGAGYLVHTNHYLCEKYASPENFKRSLADSFPRLDRIDSLIKSRYGSIEVDDIKRFLSDHSGYPTSICRHDSSMRTVASMISEPARRRMHVAVGNPCQHQYVTYSM